MAEELNESRNFAAYKSVIDLDDTVILYFSPNDMRAVQITKDLQLHTHLGLFRLAECVGQPYGSKFYSCDRQKFVILLHPTPELWTAVLPHRTQILYLADISFITWMLQLGPGSIVVESGTGSGSFTHSLARTVYPHGHVFTFEYHKERYEAAGREFRQHALSPSVVTVAHADVVSDGFGAGCCGVADAVFLDLPKPWDAIENAKRVFNKERPGRICCFSPCIEQVQKTVSALGQAGFQQIVMYECLMKDYSVTKRTLKAFPLDSGKKSEQIDNNLESDRKRIRPDDSEEIFHTNRLNMTSKYALQSMHECRGHTSYLTFATLFPPIEAPLTAKEDINNQSA